MKHLYKESTQLIFIACLGLIGLWHTIRPLQRSEDSELEIGNTYWIHNENPRISEYLEMKAIPVNQAKAQMVSYPQNQRLEMEADSSAIQIN